MSKSPNTPTGAGGGAHIPGKKYRYPGVQPFSTEQSALFKGRDEDTERLVSLIQQEKLCVLFGKSGYGKSSLLNAGIIPALQAESEKGHRHFLPVSIRFYAASGKDDNLFKKFGFHSESALSKKYPSRHLESPSLELPDTLWGRFKRRQIPPDTTIILLFDQFEEFFSYPEEQQVEFKKQLSELIYADFPDFIDENESRLTAADTAFLETKIDARAVFSIRKDRLADLDRLKDKLPAILHKRIELLPLSRQQARAALVEPAELDGDFESVKFTWSAAATSRILDALSQDKSGQEIGVEAFQLQILAEYIENRIIRNEIPDLDADGMPDVRPDDLPSDLRNVYGEYYRRKINELPEARRAVAREIIEEDLVSGEKEEDARRLSMDGVRLLSRPGADAALLNELVDTFLLRREPNTVGGYNYELCHDALLKPVLDWRKENRAEVERFEIERKVWKQKDNLTTKVHEQLRSAMTMFTSGYRMDAIPFFVSTLDNPAADATARTVASCLLGETYRGIGDFDIAQQYYEVAIRESDTIPESMRSLNEFVWHYRPRAFCGLLSVYRRILFIDHEKIKSTIKGLQSDRSHFQVEDLVAQASLMEGLYLRQLGKSQLAISSILEGLELIGEASHSIDYFLFLHPEHFKSLLLLSYLCSPGYNYQVRILSREIQQGNHGPWSRAITAIAQLHLHFRHVANAQFSRIEADEFQKDYQKIAALIAELKKNASLEKDPFLLTECTMLSLIWHLLIEDNSKVIHEFSKLARSVPVCQKPLALLRIIEIASLQREFELAGLTLGTSYENMLELGQNVFTELHSNLGSYGCSDTLCQFWKSLMALENPRSESLLNIWASDELNELRSRIWP